MSNIIVRKSKTIYEQFHNLLTIVALLPAVNNQHKRNDLVHIRHIKDTISSTIHKYAIIYTGKLLMRVHLHGNDFIEGTYRIKAGKATVTLIPADYEDIPDYLYKDSTFASDSIGNMHYVRNDKQISIAYEQITRLTELIFNIRDFLSIADNKGCQSIQFRQPLNTIDDNTILITGVYFQAILKGYVKE